MAKQTKTKADDKSKTQDPDEKVSGEVHNFDTLSDEEKQEMGAAMINACNGDAIFLLELAWRAANSDRFRRNNHVMTIVRGYANEQGQMREMQGRIDQRNADRVAANAEANEKAEAEDKGNG